MWIWNELVEKSSDVNLFFVDVVDSVFWRMLSSCMIAAVVDVSKRRDSSRRFDLSCRIDIISFNACWILYQVMLLGLQRYMVSK